MPKRAWRAICAKLPATRARSSCGRPKTSLRPTPHGSRSAKQSSRHLNTEFDLRRAREVGVRAARSAGAILRERVDAIHEIRHKGVIDIVTEVDLLSEKEVCASLLAAFPTHSILAEEGGARAGSDPRYRWIVDPLDGTTNYAHGFPFFCVSIALEVDSRLVLGIAYAPSLDELFVAEAGRGATLD